MDERIVVVFILVTLMIKSIVISENKCETSIKTKKIVNACPSTRTEMENAAEKMNCHKYRKNNTCSKDPDNMFYHCVLNEFGNKSLEVCAPKTRIIAHCTEFNEDAGIIQPNYFLDCTTFERTPCGAFYDSNEAFLFQECYNYTNNAYIFEAVKKLFTPSQRPRRNTPTLYSRDKGISDSETVYKEDVRYTNPSFTLRHQPRKSKTKHHSFDRIVPTSDIVLSNVQPGTLKSTAEEATNFLWQHVRIIDTPGVYGSNQEEKTIKYEIAKGLRLAKLGPQALLFVTRIGKFTAEDKEAVEFYERNFGIQVTRYIVIVFTGKEKKIIGEGINNHDYVKSLNPKSKLKIMMKKKTEHGYVAFSDTCYILDQKKNVDILLDMIGRMMMKNLVNPYFGDPEDAFGSMRKKIQAMKPHASV